jgi:hypothetical protein
MMSAGAVILDVVYSHEHRFFSLSNSFYMLFNCALLLLLCDFACAMYISQIAEELFTAPGSQDDILLACSCLDTSTPFSDKCTAQSIAQVLLLLLKTLPEPVVCTYSYMGTCSEHGA